MRTRHTSLRLWLPVTLALSSSALASDFGDPLSGLSAEEVQSFADGKAAFEAIEDAAEGLGPVFNGTSCAGCHNVGATGGGSETLETRFAAAHNGSFDALDRLGGSLIQTDGIGAAGDCDYVGEVVPAEATIVAQRRATPLFGLGLVDAVPDTTFVALAATEARRQPSTAGRPNMVTDVSTGQIAVGKFGWKSQVPNLLHFSAEAYLNEMGITTPLFPDEVCPQGDCSVLTCDPVPGVDDDLEDVELFADFMSFLAPPPPLRATRSFQRSDSARRGQARNDGSAPRSRADGYRLFTQIGCADCHVRSLASGPSPVAALRFRTFQPYSDFLLHDMGSLGDGIEQGEASGREMRTAPLWGLRLFTTFLHDGSAATIADAILAHDGQGRAARERFAHGSAEDKATLLAFLGTL